MIYFFNLIVVFKSKNITHKYYVLQYLKNIQYLPYYSSNLMYLILQVTYLKWGSLYYILYTHLCICVLPFCEFKRILYI